MSKKLNLLFILLILGVITYTIYDHEEGKATERALAQQQAAADERAIDIGNKVGQRAPHLELMDLAGNYVQLSDYRGKKVLVNFWATWCSPCRDELPDMQQIYEDFSDDLIVLGVNLTMAEPSVEEVRSFIEETKVTFPIVLDRESHALNVYRVIVYPTTFVLDEEGIIHEVFFGAIDYETMQHTLDTM